MSLSEIDTMVSNKVIETRELLEKVVQALNWLEETEVYDRRDIDRGYDLRNIRKQIKDGGLGLLEIYHGEIPNRAPPAPAVSSLKKMRDELAEIPF